MRRVLPPEGERVKVEAKLGRLLATNPTVASALEYWYGRELPLDDALMVAVEALAQQNDALLRKLGAVLGQWPFGLAFPDIKE